MPGLIQARLEQYGIILPGVAAPAGNYAPAVRTGPLLFISGQLPLLDGRPDVIGALGREVDPESGFAAARLCGLNIVAQAKAFLGDLDRVERVVKLTGYVASAADFTDQPKVVNGASDLMVEVFGDKGVHARAAVGVAALPLGVPVEVEAILEIS
ncbi:MAG: RidA family protein [Alphaproteobacteria bacterium]|jgi:enamine deaminase RidA (YjgF/YER057c/UK114 family)|nr:RidA family protein [Alphaproteobacteria bacterium]